MDPFTSQATCVLTSTTSSQTVSVNKGQKSLVVYNAASNPVYLSWASSVAVPGSTWAGNVMCVAPGSTQTFDIPLHEGTLAYIAATAGGTLVLSLGDGV